MNIKITVLLENHAIAANLISEKGLSLLIEDGQSKILFDTGKSGAFISNAEALGVNLRDLTHIVLSHGHDDHTGGLPSLVDHLKENKVRGLPLLVSHPDAFYPKRMLLEAVW